MSILKFIFIIFLGTFCLGEVIRFDLGNNISIKPVDIAAIILFLTWTPHVFKKWKKDVRSNSLFIPIISIVIVMFVSLLFNIKNFSGNEIFVGLSYILRWILYMSLFFVVKSFPNKFKEKIVYLLLGIGAVITFFGFIQYFFYPNLRNLYYLGWDEHIHRMFSTFLDPNFAGAFFVLYLTFLTGMLLFFLKNNKTKQALFMGFISVFTLTSVYLTYSRSALIMLFVSAFIFLTLIKKIRWLIVIIGVSMLFILISSRNYYIENINLFRTASAEARIDSAKVVIEIIKNNPFFGVGFNTYRYAQIKYGFRSAVGSSISHADAGTDNSFLFILATTGIVGLIFYLNLLREILKRTYLNHKKFTDHNIQKYIGIIIISSVGGIIFDSFFVNSLFYSFVMIWMWILLGLIENN